MDGILSIFQSIASSDGENLSIYLKAIEEHQSFRLKNSSGTDPVVQHITSVLSKPATRYDGLILLNSYLEQCSAEVLEQKAHLWLTLVLKSCNSKEAENVGSMVYVVIKSLATKSTEIADVSKMFVSNYLSKIYESLSTVIPCAYLAALQCVEACLRLYPGPSGPSYGSVDKFISKFIDCSDESLVVWSGKCFHLLQQVRGGGVQGISHKVAWQNYQVKLLGSLHSVLDSAFENCAELYEDAKETEQLNVAPLKLSDEPVQKAMQIYIRLRNLIKYLVIALRQPFPVPKAIMPKKILNAISRGLNVTCTMLQVNKISDNMAIGALLPQIQVHFFELLEATVLTLKSNLAMYHNSILGFVFDTLKWTSSKKSSGNQKPYSNLRSAAYKALTLWCNTMKYGSRCEIIAEGIVEEILFDITPFENTFTLKVLSGAKKHMSKKARRQLHKAQNEQSNLGQTHANASDAQSKKHLVHDEGNQKLCIAAFECFASVFLSAGSFLKPTFVKSSHLKIVTICLSLSNTTPKSNCLYSNYLCRLGLYNALQCFILAPHHLCPPPTQITIQLLQSAQIKDTSETVRFNCSAILSHLEKITHPQKESLVFPSDIRDIRNAFQKVGKERLLVEPLGNVDESDSENSENDGEQENDADIHDADIDDADIHDADIHDADIHDADIHDADIHDADIHDTDIQEIDDEMETEALPDVVEDVGNSIDLTLEDSRLRDPIHVESSNDSVQFIQEDRSNLDERNSEKADIETIELAKSPEMTLRVEEEDDDIEQEPSADKEITPESAEMETDDVPPSHKKPRLDESASPHDVQSKDDVGTADKENEKDKNEISFEDIAAEFVDELNPDF